MRLALLTILTISQIFSLTVVAASAQPSVDTIVGEDMLKAMPKNMPMGTFEEFRKLTVQYFETYAMMSQAQQDTYEDEFLQALTQNANFENATKNADSAVKKVKPLDVAVVEMAVTQAALLDNLLKGTTTDFNQKIVTLAGIYVFDPESAPAIYQLFKTLNDNYFTNDYFRGLNIDAHKSEQFRRGMVAAASIALLITALDPEARRNFGESLSTARSRVKSGLAYLQSILPKADTVAGATEAEQVEAQLARAESNFRSLGLSGVDNRTDARLLQDAMGGDTQAQRILEARMAAKKMTVNVSAKPLNLEKAEKAKWYTNFFTQSPRSNFIWFRNALGFGVAGGVASVTVHSGVDKLFNYVYNPVNPIFEYIDPARNFIVNHTPSWIANHVPNLDPTTRLVPLDEGALKKRTNEHELLDTAYNGLAALKFSCDVDAFSKNVLSLKQASPEVLEALKTELVDKMVQYNVMLSSASYFATKQCVSNAIHYDFATHEVVMSLPEGKDSIEKKFACEKYAPGFNGNCLAVSLKEVKGQLNQTYSAIQLLSVGH